MIIPFINFKELAGEAIAFYETVFEVKNKQVSYYHDIPDHLKEHFPDYTMNNVLHAEMILNGSPIWISDTTEEVVDGELVTLAIPFTSEEDVLNAFNKLKIDGTVLMEPERTDYSPFLGMVKDKFGVIWHLICK